MRAISTIALVAFTAFVGMAHAAEPGKSGFYVGGEFGAATAATNVDAPPETYNAAGTTLGWSIFAGVRPTKYLGAEINYINFGTVSDYNLIDGAGGITYKISAKNQAYGLDAIGYLPLTEGWELFGKLGYASLRTNTQSNGNYPDIGHCSGPCDPLGIYSQSNSNNASNFAWGLGAQYHFDSVSVRVGYQQINGGSGNSPELTSLGLAWQF